MLLARTSERQGRMIDHDQRRVDGEEEAGGIFLTGARLRPHRHRHRRIPAAARTQEPAALHHLRQRRRRQEHAHRPAALRVARCCSRTSSRRVEADSKKWGTQGGDIDFALLVDGLAAEREQGITIDVAYRFFSHRPAQVHRRRHARATSSTRATWSPAPPPPTWP
ncbi:MAG: hypothetical protein MZW92_72985 [Comamonadaceae bacterium]|nr:hypothetical protein [Comamonadaceae bacterium]